MKDKVIKCKNCGQDFAWTTDEQAFYKQKDLKPPLRCPICRAAFKVAEKDKFRGKIARNQS